MVNREYLRRQIAFLGAQGHSAKRVLEKLSGQVDSQDVERLLRGEDEGGPGADILLPLLLRRFGDEEEALNASVRYQRFKKELTEVTASARGMLGGLAGYAAVVGTVALLVYSMLAIFVIPRFEEWFANFGAELPALTRAVVDLSNLAVSFGTILLLLPFALAAWLMLSTRRTSKVLALERRPGWLLLPFSPHRRLLRFHCDLINLWLVQLAHELDRNLDEALQLGDQVLADYSATRGLGKSLSPEQRSALEQCASIGTLADELDYQVTSAMLAMPMKLVHQRQLLQILTQILLTVAVGTMIVALYLPIFKLGGAI